MGNEQLHKIEVRVPLPFFLRAEEALRVPYEELCDDEHIPQLVSRLVHISFERWTPPSTTRADWQWPQTTLVLVVESPQIGEHIVPLFAIRDCTRIVNRVVRCYQAATNDWQNSGLISALGEEYLQLHADVLFDGHSVRDRWPSPSFFSMPLTDEQSARLKEFVQGGDLPLDELYHTYSFASLAGGEYSLSIVQNATAVEIRLTEEVCSFLVERSTPQPQINAFRSSTLGRKLNHYFSNARFQWSNHAGLLDALKEGVNAVRNKILHHGHLATREEALAANTAANDFLRMDQWVSGTGGGAP